MTNINREITFPFLNDNTYTERMDLKQATKVLSEALESELLKEGFSLEIYAYEEEDIPYAIQVKMITIGDMESYVWCLYGSYPNIEEVENMDFEGTAVEILGLFSDFPVVEYSFETVLK